MVEQCGGCVSAGSFPVVAQEVALRIAYYIWYMLMLNAYQVTKKVFFFFFLQEFYFGRTLDLLKYIVNTALLGALLVKLLEFIAT